MITIDGIDGDSQSDRRFHGGPDRAVVLFSLDVIRAIRAEGHPIGVGTTGENLTVSGVDWSTLVPGLEVRIADVRLLITKYASPCAKIRGSFLHHDVTRISQNVHAGCSRLCARVLAEGIVRIGDALTLG